MRLPVIRRILKEDLARSGEELPKWLDSLLEPLNEALDQIVLSIRNNLTLRDNMNTKEFEGTFTSGTAQEVSITSKSRPIGVLVVDAAGKTVTGYGFTRLVNGNISVTLTFSGGGSAKCKIYILLE